MDTKFKKAILVAGWILVGVIVGATAVIIPNYYTDWGQSLNTSEAGRCYCDGAGAATTEEKCSAWGGSCRPNPSEPTTPQGCIMFAWWCLW